MVVSVLTVKCSRYSTSATYLEYSVVLCCGLGVVGQ